MGELVVKRCKTVNIPLYITTKFQASHCQKYRTDWVYATIGLQNQAAIASYGQLLIHIMKKLLFWLHNCTFKTTCTTHFITDTKDEANCMY